MNLDKILSEHKTWLKTGGQEGTRADLCYANLTDCNLQYANLQYAHLEYADLTGARLQYSKLQYANLQSTLLYDADLTGADLQCTNLTNANLECAKLRGTTLQHAKLLDTNLQDCSGNRNEIKSVSCSEDYAIVYTSTHLQIGCERHPIEDWWGFDDRTILSMGDEKALKFWNEWKELLQTIIEKSPATPRQFQIGC